MVRTKKKANFPAKNTHTHCVKNTPQTKSLIIQSQMLFMQFNNLLFFFPP